MGIILGSVNILLGLYVLWQFARFNRLFCRCQHPPKFTGHYPQAIIFLVSGGLCIIVSLLNRLQNDLLDFILWLAGLIVLLLWPVPKQSSKQEINKQND